MDVHHDLYLRAVPLANAAGPPTQLLILLWSCAIAMIQAVVQNVEAG